MVAKIIITLLLVAVVTLTTASHLPEGGPQQLYGPPQDHKKESGMPFDFEYKVKDYFGNDFSHKEQSDGTVTSGTYTVVLPDGRTQIVTFTADHENGYIADVKYEGEATYPETKPSPYDTHTPPSYNTHTPPPYTKQPEPLYGLPQPYHG